MKIPNIEALFSAVPDILCVIGFDGRFALINPACALVLGLSAQETHGRLYLDSVHPDDLKVTGLAFRRLVEGERDVMWHCRFARKDGSYRKLHWHATGDIAGRQIYAAGRDVTEFSVNEELLKEADAHAVNTVEHSLEGILRTLPTGQIIMANPAAARMLGYESPEDLIEQVSFLEHNLFVDAVDREILAEHLTREGTVKFECQCFRKDQTAIWVSMKARAVRQRNGALLYYEKFLVDLTEERKLEVALHVAETKYRSLVENAPFGIYRISLDGRFLDVNHALVAMLGYESREEVMMLNIEADVYCEPGMRSLLITQFGNVERIDNVIVDWRRKNGTPIAVRLSGRKIRDTFGVLEGFEVIAENLQASQTPIAVEYFPRS